MPLNSVGAPVQPPLRDARTALYSFHAFGPRSGKLQLSSQEASTYRAAAQRLHEACEMALDLKQPISVEDWILLEITHAALTGDLGLLDGVVAKVEAEIDSRKLRN